MKFTFIGVGSAFTKKNYNSNMIIEDNGKRLLIDCGRTAPEAIRELGLDWKDLDALYISHQHSDHIGAIEEMAFFNYFVLKRRPALFCNEKLCQDLWNNSLQGGLASIEGKICTLESYFNVYPVGLNESFVFNNTVYTLIQTVHVMNGYSIVPSYGLFWRTLNNKVFLTTDTQYCPSQIMQFYKDADIIFQDCETAPFKSGVHAHYTDLKNLPAEIKSKMWLYHYNDGELPDAKAEGFAGFASKGQTFEL